VSAAVQGRACAALMAGAMVAAGGAAAQTSSDWRNVTAGGPLKPGIYGRIVIKGPSAPPVIYPQPVIASEAVVPPGVQPVYLYVPPGQVRKWKQNCAKWQACEQPVLFVRVDDSPSRWGQWRQRRDQVALQERD
jgi:hypothetical protein